MRLSLAKRSLRGNELGFSLVSVILSTGIIALVAVESVALLAHAKSIELSSGLSIELDKEHLVLLQKARSIKFLKQNLNLAAGSPLGNCVAKIGTNCTDFVPTQNIPAGGSTQSCGVDCAIVSTMTYSGSCTASDCSMLQIVALTQVQNGDKRHYKARRTEFIVPGVFLADKFAIDFACAKSNNVQGINLGTFAAECKQDASTGCSGLPLAGFNPLNPIDPTRCQALIQQNCPAGTVLKTAGLFQGQGLCATR